MSITKTNIKNAAPLVMHIIHRLAVGGLENGLVNLINHMPLKYYRHAILCLTESTEFRNRLKQNNVPIISLHKRDGKDFSIYARVLRIIKFFKPEILHTRNIAGLEYQALAALCRVPGRIHSEHGLNMNELDGLNMRYNLLRKMTRPLVNGYIAVSDDLANWLIRRVNIRPERMTRIYNGVDTQRFYPCEGHRPSLGPEDFILRGRIVIGTVGRMEEVKNQLTLVKAFVQLLNTEPKAHDRLRLVIVGNGSLRETALQILEMAGAKHLAWLPGERENIPDILNAMDIFVLPSLREGISNTILEAMSSGLPVIATRVGGNPELVEEGVTGLLVPPADASAIANAIRFYLNDHQILSRHGKAGRKRAETQFSMEAMVKGYLAIYDSILRKKIRQ